MDRTSVADICRRRRKRSRLPHVDGGGHIVADATESRGRAPKIERMCPGWQIEHQPVAARNSRSHTNIRRSHPEQIRCKCVWLRDPGIEKGTVHKMRK